MESGIKKKSTRFPTVYFLFSQYLFVYLVFAQQLSPPPEGLEKQKPPKELKLTSILYELAISPDRENFAKNHNIFLQEGKVRVFIYMDPSSTKLDRSKLVKSLNIDIEKTSNNLLRALVPIDKLIPLSKEPIIWSISLPDKPTKP